MQSEDVTLRRAKSRNVCRSSHDAHRYVVHLVDDDALTFHSLFLCLCLSSLPVPAVTRAAWGDGWTGLTRAAHRDGGSRV